MKSGFIEKCGSIGAFLTALACPACFPLLAATSAALGLGVFQPLEGIVFTLFKIFVFIALIGNVLAYLKHQKLILLIVGVLGPLLVFFRPICLLSSCIPLHGAVRAPLSLHSKFLCQSAMCIVQTKGSK